MSDSEAIPQSDHKSWQRYLIPSVVVIILLGAAGFIFGGSSGKVTTVDLEKYRIELETDLVPLETGFYEAWIEIIDEPEPLSAGKFKESGNVSLNTTRALENVSNVFISIESESDTNTIPSGIIVLEGELQGGQANLAMPFDFSAATGTYLISTPTDGPDTNETSGIWLVAIADDELLPSVTIPLLTGGWKYELWLQHAEQYISLGKFSQPDRKDGFKGYSGPEPAPPFPGEDLLQNAPPGFTFPFDVTTGSTSIVVSLEPELGGLPVIGSGPSQIRPIQTVIVASTTPHISHPLTVTLDTLPTGTAFIR